MDKLLFSHGISELELFFKNFKPSDSQLEAWYERLKHFSENEFRLGIFNLTDSRSSAPGFYEIKQAFFRARRTLKAPKSLLINIPGGCTYPSQEKRDAIFREFYPVLGQIANPKNYTPEERREAVSVAKAAWGRFWRSQPNRLSVSEVQKLVDDGNWNELIELQIIHQLPKLTSKPYFPPRFTSEKVAVVEVQPDGDVIL